jgi:hypothetical protein
MSTAATATVQGCFVVAEGAVASHTVGELRLDFDGVAGDRHVGATRRSTSREPWYERGTIIRNDRQISIVSAEELAVVAKAMGLPALDPRWIGANLVVAGVPDLSALLPGTRLFFPSGTTVKIEAENGPCRVAGRSIATYVPGREGLELMFPKVARHRRGLVASIERPGTIAVGESFRVRMPSIRRVTGALL